MRVRLKPWVFVTLLAIATAAILFGIYRYRHRFVRSSTDMLALLPDGDRTVFFADFAALRHAGMLSWIAGSKAAEEPEYREFIRQTHFDYVKNIDAIAGAADPAQAFFVVRGRFDWLLLRAYAERHGGNCSDNFCKVQTTTPGRWASFFVIQPDVIGLALSGNSSAANALRPYGHGRFQPVSARPVWVKVSRALLKNPLGLPLPLRIFAITLQSTDRVVLSLASAAENSQAAFSLELEAQCPSEATAETTRNQLQIETKMLKLELAREHQPANPADLTGLLTSGTFQVLNRAVVGSWPVRKELLRTLEQ
ncbi:MAG: hypothetical protein WB992_17335 [Bryobacteraceae bacterium]